MHKKAIKHMALSRSCEEPAEVKLSQVLNKSKQEDYLEVHFTERAIHCKTPEHHYYVLTHCDESGEINLYIDKTWNLEDVDWDMRDEVCGEWIKDAAGKYHLLTTVYVGYESDAAERKEIFKEHISECVNLMIHGDAALVVLHPTLLDAPVSICYNDGSEDCSDIEELGLIKDHLHTAIKK